MLIIKYGQRSDYVGRTDYDISRYKSLLMMMMMMMMIIDPVLADPTNNPGVLFARLWQPHWFINQELGGVRSHINMSPT